MTAQLPLGAVYVPPLTNAPANFLRASTANNGRILGAWTGTETTLYGCTFYLSTQGGAAAWRNGSISGTLDSILATAQGNGLNMVRVTDFFDNSTITQQWDSPTIWANIDYLVSAAQLRNMYVMMDVSAWKKWMLSQGGTGIYDPTVAANWTAMLQALGNHYQNAKNICWYSILGEPSVPVDAATTTALVSFYQSLTDTLAAADTNHLVTLGGLNQMEQHPELSWWQQLYALPHNHICSYKTYSQDDLDYTNFIGRYVATLGKPLAQNEFGAEQILGDTVYSGTSWNGVTVSMADYYRQVYRRGAQAGASSFVFWNLGFEVNPTGFDISPNVNTGTWTVVNEAATGTSPITITVNGSALSAALYTKYGALELDTAVGQRSTARLTLEDTAGGYHFDQGTPIVVTDDFKVKLFGGVITDVAEKYPDPAVVLLEHDISCADWHYLADKRRFPYANTNATLGAIVKDMVNQVLAAEGVTAAYGGNALSPNQSNGAEENLQGFVAVNNSVLSQDPTQVCPLAGGLGGSLKVVASGAQGFQAIEARIPVQAIPGAAGTQITISAYIKCLSGTPTVRFYIQGASSALGSTTTITLSTTWTRYTWTATMPNPIVGGSMALRVDTGSTPQAVTFWMDGLQIEQGNSATAWQLGGIATVQAGPLISEFTSNYETCAACLDALAQAAAFTWQIDANKVLWCGAHGQVIAPWSATARDMLSDSVSGDRTNPLYRNRQYMLGVLGQTSTQIETRIGDGNTQVFLMSYALSTVPTVEVKIGAGAFTAKTVGIGGVDTGKDWYWNAGKNEVFQDSGGTKLTNADTLRVTYIGEFPTIILSSNDAEVTAQLAREGGVGTGYVEDVTTDSSIKTTAGAFQAAAGYLARYAQLGRKLSFTTLRGGLAPGQLLPVTLPQHAFNGDPTLIESVRATHHDGRFWYEVVALLGPINSTWVQFFQALAAQNKSTVDKINLGSSNTVTLLQSFAATASKSATFTATVYACPICNTTTFCGTSVFVC